MIDSKIREQYIPTVGIECHVQLKTKTKLFAAVGNDARQAAPNSLASHICFGLPGALPVLNREAVHLAMRAAFALNTSPQPSSYFERKHYFYPDLPMGYQISQLHSPIIVGGQVSIEVDGQPKTVHINRAQLEADAGKNTHPAGADYSLVDLNRAGTPLLEIVSEPDMHSPAEAKAYVRELYLLMRYADVSDCDLYYGNMRFDVNVSVSKTGELGTRTETKNLNSFRAVEKSVEFEITRQIELLEKGEAVVQETRGWDEAKQKTVAQRTKEEAHDYRYMPDPDIPPLVIDENWTGEVRAEMPVLPAEWRIRLESLGLDVSAVETLLDAEVEDADVEYLSLIEGSLDNITLAKFIASWEINIEIPWRREGIANVLQGISTADRLRYYTDIHDLLFAGKLNSSAAKILLTKLMTEMVPITNVAAYAQQNGYIQVSDEGEIAKIVEQVIAANPQAATDVQNGETKATQFLVGQVMKQSQGKANPTLAQDLIKEQLATQTTRNLYDNQTTN